MDRGHRRQGTGDKADRDIFRLVLDNRLLRVRVRVRVRGLRHHRRNVALRHRLYLSRIYIYIYIYTYIHIRACGHRVSRPWRRRGPTSCHTPSGTERGRRGRGRGAPWPRTGNQGSSCAFSPPPSWRPTGRGRRRAVSSAPLAPARSTPCHVSMCPCVRPRLHYRLLTLCPGLLTLWARAGPGTSSGEGGRGRARERERERERERPIGNRVEVIIATAGADAAAAVRAKPTERPPVLP